MSLAPIDAAMRLTAVLTAIMRGVSVGATVIAWLVSSALSTTY